MQVPLPPVLDPGGRGLRPDDTPPHGKHFYTHDKIQTAKDQNKKLQKIHNYFSEHVIIIESWKPKFNEDLC